MAAHIRKHEAVKDTGSFEVWFEDGRASGFFHLTKPEMRK